MSSGSSLVRAEAEEGLLDLLGGEAIKWFAYAFIGLVVVIFLGVVIGYFGRAFFGLLFLVVAVYLVIGLKNAFPKTDPKWLFAIFLVVLVFALAVLIW